MIFFVWVGHSHIGHADKLHIWMLSTNLSNGMWKLWRNINHPWPCDLHHVTLGQHWLLISVLFWQAIVDFLWMSVFHTRKDWKRQLQLEYFLKGSEFWVTFCLHVLFFFLFFFFGGGGREVWRSAFCNLFWVYCLRKAGIHSAVLPILIRLWFLYAIFLLMDHVLRNSCEFCWNSGEIFLSLRDRCSYCVHV